MRTFQPGTKVKVVAAPDKEGGKPTIKDGTVDEMISPGAARIKTGENQFAQASYSTGGEIGTFHLPHETKEAKDAPTAFTPGAPAQQGAAAAESRKSAV